MSPVPELLQVVSELCLAVDGVDWDPARVQRCTTQLAPAAQAATPQRLAEALGLIAARVRRSRVGEADGVAYAAISGGTLIELGAAPGPLGEALLERLPDVLQAARRFADTCLAPRRALEDPRDGVSEDEVLTEVDGFPITVPMLRAQLDADRGGASSLARLTEWVLPTVAALSRDRPLLATAAQDRALQKAAEALRGSRASWLYKLLAVQLEARWRVVLPELGRAFELDVDGVCTNFELQELVELALSSAGVPTLGRGEDNLVRGSFELLTAHALPWRGGTVPQEHVVWREGVPTDVPIVGGLRTLVAVKPSIARTWRSGQTFAALTPKIALVREVPTGEVDALLRALTR